jgi:hypothetical protein
MVLVLASNSHIVTIDGGYSVETFIKNWKISEWFFSKFCYSILINVPIWFVKFLIH